MFQPEEYELLDFGDGRRLERLGGVVVDRPCPTAAACRRRVPEVWRQADLRFERTADGSGRWTWRRPCPESWMVRHRSKQFELRPTPLGQIGIFPEQAEPWDWIEARIRCAGRPVRVLNLFAYTGGATLAAAAAGGEVVHLDAAKPVVAWARRNASRSGLAAATVRWIVEDAVRFVAREARRGRRYEALILDPPSYGHGPRGEAWKIDRHLEELLSRCAAVLADPAAFVLLTCHTPSIGRDRLRQALAEPLTGGDRRAVRVRSLVLETADGRQLPSGWAATWPE